MSSIILDIQISSSTILLAKYAYTSPSIPSSSLQRMANVDGRIIVEIEIRSTCGICIEREIQKLLNQLDQYKSLPYTTSLPYTARTLQHGCFKDPTVYKNRNGNIQRMPNSYRTDYVGACIHGNNLL